MKHRRAVITGFGLISPLGLDASQFWSALVEGASGLVDLDPQQVPYLTTAAAGQAREFTGAIEQYGPLEKTLQRAVKKGRKLMCREIEMGVAAAQLAMDHGGVHAAISAGEIDSQRIGTIFGSDHIMTEPAEFSRAMTRTRSEQGEFEFDRWAAEGLPQVEPLWLLKYLPNMPASHVAIYNDLRGPSNSITMRESSSNLALGEALTTIRRDAADMILAGASGSRLPVLRLINTCMQERLSDWDGPASGACRPFDSDRRGAVVGEGAGILVVEDAQVANRRGARVWGEILAAASSTVTNRHRVANYQQALENVCQMALRQAGMQPDQIGHVNAHGLGSPEIDEQEAAAIAQVFGDQTPVVASKGHHGNLGAGSGAVETIASLLAFEAGQLFAVKNYEQHGVSDSIQICTADIAAQLSPGDSFINLNITPQGQASAIIVRRGE